VKFTLDGKTYDFTLDNLSLDEGEIIEDYARMDMREFMENISSGMPKIRVIRAIVFMAKKRAGEDVRWADLGSVDLMELVVSMFSENVTQAAEAAKAGPDPAAGEGGAAVASPEAVPAAKLRKAAPRKRKATPSADAEPAQAS